MARLGFHVDRTITIEGPFDRHPYYADVKGAQATVETQVRRRLIGSPSL